MYVNVPTLPFGRVSVWNPSFGVVTNNTPFRKTPTLVVVAPDQVRSTLAMPFTLYPLRVREIGLAGAVTVTDFDVEAVAPPLSVTVNVTVYVPAAEYPCVGFCTVEEVPSPKFQLHDAIVPSESELPSVKGQDRFVHELVKAAVGALLPPPPPPKL